MAVGMIAIAIVGVIMNALFLEIEKRVIPWSTHHG
jgi:ABC-type nitrate/sulfonate/bicarbonate transport system permease component